MLCCVQNGAVLAHRPEGCACLQTAKRLTEGEGKTVSKAAELPLPCGSKMELAPWALLGNKRVRANKRSVSNLFCGKHWAAAEVLELLIDRLLWFDLVLFHIIMIFYEHVWVLMKALVQYKMLALDDNFLVFFMSKWIFPMSYLSVCTHMHMHVHLGIVRYGKCSGNVKYYNYVQSSFLVLLCSQLGKGSSVSGQSRIWSVCAFLHCGLQPCNWNLQDYLKMEWECASTEFCKGHFF